MIAFRDFNLNYIKQNLNHANFENLNIYSSIVKIVKFVKIFNQTP